MVTDRPPGQGPPGSGALPGTGDHRRALSGAGVLTRPERAGNRTGGCIPAPFGAAGRGTPRPYRKPASSSNNGHPPIAHRSPIDPRRPCRGHACVTRQGSQARKSDSFPHLPAWMGHSTRWIPSPPTPSPTPRGRGGAASAAGVRGVRSRAKTWAVDCRACGADGRRTRRPYGADGAWQMGRGRVPMVHRCPAGHRCPCRGQARLTRPAPRAGNRRRVPRLGRGRRDMPRPDRTGGAWRIVGGGLHMSNPDS